MIEVERRTSAVVVHMRDGENRFNPAFIAALGGALDEVEAIDPALPLVLTGEGKFFSNGLDLAWMGGEGASQAGELVGDVLALFARLLEFSRLTVSAINGHAFAGGGMLALATDFRLMRADRGYFCLPEIDLGLPLHPGMTALITARLPGATAHEAIVTGRRFGGEDAVTAGIAETALPAEELLEAAIGRAAVGVGKSTETMRALKQGLYPETLAALRGAVAGNLPDLGAARA